MSDYNLGTAHGKVVVDYHDRGSGKATSGLDNVERSIKKVGDRSKGSVGSTSDFDSSLSSLGGTAAAARTRLAQLAAATLAYRAANMATIPTIKDITAKIAALGKVAKKPAKLLGGAGFAIMGRSLSLLGTVVSTTIPSMLGSLLSLRAVMRGVPQEMKSWPKMIQTIVGLATTITFLKKSADWVHKGPKGGLAGIYKKFAGDTKLAEKAVASLSQRIKKDFPEAHKHLAEFYRSSSSAIVDLTKGMDKSISTIAQAAMGIVFLGRTGKAVATVYHGLAWGIERFTWAMGAAGLGSLAFLKVMAGATTLVRGTGDAIKQLSKVSYLLPGAIFAITASVATAMVGFKGFGDALAAVGADQDKFNEATKGLAGSAKDLAVEIRAVRKDWSDFQQGVQEKVFAGLGDRFAVLSEKYLPALTEGMGKSADGLNHLFHRFGDFAEQQRTVDLINKGFQDTGTILEHTGNALQPFLEGFREMGSVGVEAIASYSKAWEGLGDRFSVWAMVNAESGQMRKWMDDSIKGFGDLWKITKNLGGAISNTFRPFFKGDVDNSLERAASATERWVSYMSPQGKGGQVMQGFASHLQAMAAPWEKYLPKIMEKFGSLLDSLLPVMERFSSIAAKEANTILAILVPALKAALAVVDALGPALAFLIIVLSALRTLNWIRKALMWLFSPLTNAAAAVAAFRQSMKDVRPATNDMRKGIVGLSPGLRSLAKGMGEVGKESAAFKKAESHFNRFHGAYARLYGATTSFSDRVTGQLNKVGDGFRNLGTRVQTFGRTTSTSMQNAAARVGIVGRSFGQSAEVTTAGLSKLATSSIHMRDNIASSSQAILKNKDSILVMGRTADQVAKSQESVAKSSANAVKSTVNMAKSNGIVTRSMQGMRAAGSGVLDVLGGPWGAALGAAAVVGMTMVETNRMVTEANQKMAESAREGASAQRDLMMAAALSGGERNDDTQDAAGRMAKARLDEMKASADAATGAFNIVEGPLHRLRNDYDGLGKVIATTTNETTKQKAANGQARLEQQALNDALKATGMTMDEAQAAFASGGPSLDRLQSALRDTGSAGRAVIDNMGEVAVSIQETFDHVAEVGPRAAALGSAMEVISDAASDAESKLNALRTVLQSLGLMDDSNFDAAQATAESIRNLADVAAGAATGVDQFGKSFWTATGELNPFNAEAGKTQDKLTDLRENLLQMDPHEAMAGFQEALPALEALRVQIGATDEQWAGVLATMGLTPESIETQIAIQGMDETEQQLWAVQKQIELQDGKTANVKVNLSDEGAIEKLQQMGWRVDDFDAKTGTATLTAPTEEVASSLEEAAGMIENFALHKGKAQLDADYTPLLNSIDEATGWIGAVDGLLGTGILDAENSGVSRKTEESTGMILGLNGVWGEGSIDADNSPVKPKVDASRSNIESLNSARGVGILDVIDNGIAGKVAAAQALIDGLRGRSIYIDVISRVSGPMPSGAGTLDAFGQTGGKFTGDSFNLKGYRAGGRHRGYRLPSQGPGTEITDGFLALNSLGAPIARLDKDEWVINGKSSKKWNRLLAAINNDDPKLKMLQGFRDGGMMGNMRAQIGKVSSATQVVSAQLNLEANAAQIEAAAGMLGELSSEEFAAKFGKGIADGLNLGSRQYFIDQGKQYSEALGLVFGKAAEEANERLKEEINKIEDKNLKEQREKTIKSTEELQAIADAEMMEWVNNNKFEVMGYTMAKSFADGVSSGQNLLQAGIGALGQAATLALAAAGAPGLVAGLAVTALTGLFDAFSDPDLWADGLFEGIYKIIDRMLAGLVTMVLDVLRNLFLMIGIDLAKVPIIGALFDIKDAANGTSKAIDKLMSDIEALNKLEYKNLGKMGATDIDGAIAAGLGNRVMDNRVTAGAGYSGASEASRIGTMNVYAPSDRAGDILEAATFEMKRV